MNNMEIVEYAPQYRADFAQLNLAWIEKYFKVEAPDRQAFENPEKKILAGGGRIFFALLGGHVVGTVALIPEGEGVYELAKMAVDEDYRGFGIGKKLCLRALDAVRSMGGHRLVLESNTVLVPAIELYKSLGFIRVENFVSPYERANIRMEMEVF